MHSSSYLVYTCFWETIPYDDNVLEVILTILPLQRMMALLVQPISSLCPKKMTRPVGWKYSLSAKTHPADFGLAVQ